MSESVVKTKENKSRSTVKYRGKILLALLAAVTLLLVPVSIALADPEYGLIKASKRKHIVRNWLYESNYPGGFDPANPPAYRDLGVSGSVTFACQSLEGFQYSVAVKGLASETTYIVRAVSLPIAFVPGAGLLPTSDGPGVTYPFGSITTDGEGEGEVSVLFCCQPLMLSCLSDDTAGRQGAPMAPTCYGPYLPTPLTLWFSRPGPLARSSQLKCPLFERQPTKQEERCLQGNPSPWASYRKADTGG